MKFSIIAIAAAAAPGAMADFWISYMSREVPGVPSVVGGNNHGAIFHKEPEISCDQHKKSMIYSDTDDVSGKHVGMRTVPGNRVASPYFRDPLDIVEFNTGAGKPGHHTIYKDRGFAMFDVDGRQTGQCYENRSKVFYLRCPDGGNFVNLEGSSMFFCESELNVTYN
ncbi:uncharacterized protein GGS22DRAFT_196266 [Annulohypoxylon maeteangense]|uniref:uncharacterized protein n=1 Tax=Annulohypoxylon maeteangense TaxID=1927788 RepID=UPI00200876AB|nr:uncharacterized protein GGS22DRAFT_196266 [Annulohypoxylon maeteangense]KAI0881698.1 hypothetical protein GGS22DRAFT_196266 [Annulohypoxylon maeteangense]